MSPEASQQKPKKIVVFSANGGIGQATVKALVDQLNLPENLNTPAEIVLVAREKNGVNPAAGVRRELLEACSLKANRSIAALLKPSNILAWNPADDRNLETALQDADLVVMPGGMPRKKDPKTGLMPERAALIGTNAEMAIPMAAAVARYAPMHTPILACTNPMDNIVDIMETECKRVWDANHIEAGERPAVKVIGMGGTLDESRAKNFLAEELNQRLHDAGKLHGKDLLVRDIDLIMYGQHGPTMALDEKTIRVQGQPLEEFLHKNGLDAERAAIISSVKDKTKTAGADMERELGRTAQISTGERLAEIASALLLSPHPYELTASVVHQNEGDSRAIASGQRVKVSPQGIELVPYAVDDATKAAISKSRKTVIADQAGFELQPILKMSGTKIGRTHEDASQGFITLEFGAESRERIDQARTLLTEALQLSEPVARPIGAPPVFKIPSSPANLTTFTSLATAAGALELDETGKPKPIAVSGRYVP